jgi:hypothetical protein
MKDSYSKRIFAYLRPVQGQAFTAAEINDGIRGNLGTTSSTLKKMVTRGDLAVISNFGPAGGNGYVLVIPRSTAVW